MKEAFRIVLCSGEVRHAHLLVTACPGDNAEYGYNVDRPEWFRRDWVDLTWKQVGAETVPAAIKSHVAAVVAADIERKNKK